MIVIAKKLGKVRTKKCRNNTSGIVGIQGLLLVVARPSFKNIACKDYGKDDRRNPFSGALILLNAICPIVTNFWLFLYCNNVGSLFLGGKLIPVIFGWSRVVLL